MRANMRAGGAPSMPSLKVARLEDDTGTSLDDHLPRAPVVSDWQRRDGGLATRAGRCREGDSGSQRPNSVAPSADEMTASSRRTRWRHRGEPGTRGRGAHGRFVQFASGKPCRQRGRVALRRGAAPYGVAYLTFKRPRCMVSSKNDEIPLNEPGGRDGGLPPITLAPSLGRYLEK